MSDARLEELLRDALRTEADALPFTITTAELERRHAMRRRARNGQRLTVMAAAIAAVAVGTIVALGNGWLGMPAVGNDPTSSPAATASAAATSDGVVPVRIDPIAGRTELYRLDPRVAAEDILDTFDLRTTARVVFITTRCVGGGVLSVAANGRRLDQTCDGLTSSRVTAVDVADGGLVRGSIGVPVGVGFTLLIEEPAAGEIAEPTPTPAPTPTPQPTPRTAPSLGDADDAVLIRVDEEPSGATLVVTIAKGAADNVDLLPFPIPAGEALAVDRGQFGPGGWLLVPRSTEDQEPPPTPLLYLFDLADEGAAPRELDAGSGVAAWSRDGRLAVLDGRIIRVVDPTDGTVLTTVRLPEDIHLAEVAPGRGAWAGDGSGLLALDSSELTSERGILSLDGSFARDPFPALFAPSGLERFQDRLGRGLGTGCDSSAEPGGGCAVSAGTFEVDQEFLYQQFVEGSPNGGITDHRWTASGQAADGILLLLYAESPPEGTRFTLWRGRGTSFEELGAAVDASASYDARIGGMTADDARIVIVGINDADGRPMTASIAADEQYAISGTFVGWADPSGFTYGD